MKRKILPALALCAALIAPAMPVSADYTSESITFAIRPTKGTVLASDGCVHVSGAEAEAGTTLHFGVYFETDHAELNCVGVRVHSISEQITLPADSIVTAKKEVSESPVTYTLPDGTSFETKYQPYCLGKLTSSHTYLADCNSFLVNSISDTDFFADWFYGIGNQSAFLGGKSDQYSFLEFDAVVAPGTKDGIYKLEMLTDAASSNPEKDSVTFLRYDSGTAAESVYHDVVPTLKNITIVVGGHTEVLPGDVDKSGSVDAVDATLILKYTAECGAGGEGISADYHAFMKEVGDLNHDGSADAEDATGILIYTAFDGAGTPLTWEEIFK